MPPFSAFNHVFGVLLDENILWEAHHCLASCAFYAPGQALDTYTDSLGSDDKQQKTGRQDKGSNWWWCWYCFIGFEMNTMQSLGCERSNGVALLVITNFLPHPAPPHPWFSRSLFSLDLSMYIIKWFSNIDFLCSLLYCVQFLKHCSSYHKDFAKYHHSGFGLWSLVVLIFGTLFAVLMGIWVLSQMLPAVCLAQPSLADWVPTSTSSRHKRA